jgi:hypothetical protein
MFIYLKLYDSISLAALSMYIYTHLKENSSFKNIMQANRDLIQLMSFAASHVERFEVSQMRESDA